MDINLALQHFGLNSSSLLGKGINSAVYRLNSDQVVRIPIRKGTPFNRRRLKDLLNRIAAADLPFATPRIIEEKTIGDIVCTTEAFLPGVVFESLLNNPDRSIGWGGRQECLQGCLWAVEALRSVQAEDLSYGDIIGEKPVHTETWPHFLSLKIQAALFRSQARLEQDISGFDQIIRQFWRQFLQVVPEKPPKCLVHGDFYPGNIMVDPATYKLTALIDFSDLTIIGDNHLDRAELLSTVERPENKYPEHVLRWLWKDFIMSSGPGVVPLLRTYQIVSALCFSDCFLHDDLSTYAWCVNMLTQSGRPGFYSSQDTGQIEQKGNEPNSHVHATKHR